MASETVQVRIGEEAGAALAVSGEATVANARELQRALAATPVRGLAGGAPIDVDLGGLEALDVAGAQLLVAWRRQHGAAHVRFRACRPEVARFIAGCGLASAFCACEGCDGSA
jgi:anti-anti-sigma regulatory factor